MKKFIVFLILVPVILSAQVGINTTNPSKSAVLEIFSNSKGLLIPRIFKGYEQIPKNEGTYQSGLLYFETSINKFVYHNGSNWHVLNPESNKINIANESYIILYANKGIDFKNNSIEFDNNQIKSEGNIINLDNDEVNFNDSDIDIKKGNLTISENSNFTSETDIKVKGIFLKNKNDLQDNKINVLENKLNKFDDKWTSFSIYQDSKCYSCSKIASHRAYKMRHGKIMHYAIFIDLEVKNANECIGKRNLCRRFYFERTESFEKGSPINSNIYDIMEFQNCKVKWSSNKGRNVSEIILTGLPVRINLLISVPIQ